MIKLTSPATKIVMLSMHDADRIARAAQLGGIHIDGCLSKKSVASDLKRTLVSLGFWQST